MTTLVDDALARPLASAQAVWGAIGRASRGPGRKGTPFLKLALEVWADGITPGSPAEMRLLRRLAEWGFPTPVRQLDVYSPEGTFLGRLDLAWPEVCIGIEYDGARTHTPRDLSHDELRHAAIAAAGWVLHRADKFDLRPSADRLHQELGLSFRQRRVA